MSEENESQEQGLYIATFFARQPIFDETPAIWGYDLLYRHCAEATSAEFTDSESATLNVAASAFIHPEMGRKDPARVVVNFTQRSILDHVPYALPAGRSVVKFEEPEEAASDEFLRVLKGLKIEDYLVAVDNFSGRDDLTPLYQMADLIVVDVLGTEHEKLKHLVAKARKHKCMVLAKRVEDDEAFTRVKAIGCDLFQGYFFQHPELVPGRKLSSNESSRLNLFRIIEKDEPDFDELAQTVQTDVAISYRLLSYLNSAAFSFPQKIQSIRQAVVILGWLNVRNWLRLIILTDMLPSTKTSELPYLSAVRGKFLATVAEGHPHKSVNANSLFLLGLFSLLEAMLDTPMNEIIGTMPLDEEIKAALCGESNAYSPWMEIAECFEHGSWERLDSLMETLDLDPLVVARAYYDSLLWANSFFGYGQ